MSETLPITGWLDDSELAKAYWADKEWKTYAVDVQAGPHNKPTYKRTFYVRSRSGKGAEDWARANRSLLGTPKRCWFRARLAGPRELGAVPTPQMKTT